MAAADPGWTGDPARPVVLVVGDVVDDEVVRPRGAVEWGGETRADIAVTPGGSAANQAAWLGSLGARVRFAGRVGADDADRHGRVLLVHGVDARLVADGSAPTGRIVIVVAPDGERDMYVDPGANRNLTAADLGDDLLDGVALVHLSGYSFFPPGPRAAVRDLARRATARGAAVSVDPASAAFLREVGAAAFLEWTGDAGLVFPNLEEGRVLARRHDPDAIVDELVRHYRMVVLKLGAAGALVATATGLRLRQPAATVEVVDTTGAGDAFCAGFLARWVEERGARRPEAQERTARRPEACGAGPTTDLVERVTAGLTAGQAAARRVVTRLGARPPLPAHDPEPATPGVTEPPAARR